MLNFIQSYSGDLIVGLIILSIIVFALRSLFKSRKQGPCAKCAYAKSCGISNYQCKGPEMTLEELEIYLQSPEFQELQKKNKNP